MPLDAPTWEDTTEAPTWQDTEPEQAAPVAPPIAIKPSPYEAADIASMEAGRGKAPTGMEPGTELTTAMAGGAARALAAVPPTVQAIADFPSAFFGSVARAKGQTVDQPLVGEERAPQAREFGQWLQRPLVEIPKLDTSPEVEGFKRPGYEQVAREAVNVALSIPEFFESPLGLATMGIGGSGEAGATLVRRAFLGDMMKNLVQQYPEMISNWPKMSQSEKIKAVVDLSATAAMAGGLAKPEMAKVSAPFEARTAPEGPVSPEFAPTVSRAAPAPMVRAPQLPPMMVSPAPMTAPMPVSANRPEVAGDIMAGRRMTATPEQAAQIRAFQPRPVPAEKPTGAILKTGTQPLSGTQEPIYNAEDWARYQDIAQRIAAEPDPMKKAPLIGERETLKEKYGNAAPAQVTASPQDLIPALRTKEGQEIPGQKGGSHDDIYEAQGKPADSELRVSQPEHGFLWKGKFLSRRQAADLIGEKDELHSERLAELQKSKPEAPKPAAPAPEAKAPAPAPVTPAVAAEKVQEAITERVVTDPVPSSNKGAKQARALLIQHIQKLIEESPTAADTHQTTQTDKNGNVVWIESKEPLKKVTIEIPGDGEFTVIKTKENLTELLARAKGIKTNAQKIFKESKPAAGIPPEVWVESSEPTHMLESVNSEGVTKKFPASPVSLKNKKAVGLEFYLTSDGETFIVREARTGAGVGASAETASKAIKNAEEHLDELPDPKKNVADFIAAHGERPKPVPIQSAALAAKQQPALVGMGGAVPAEFEGANTYVSNMFAAIERDRAKRGEPPMPETKKRTWDEANQRALAQMNRNPDWIPNLLRDVTANPRPLLDWENAGVVWHRAKLDAEANNALERTNRSFEDRNNAPSPEAKYAADQRYVAAKLESARMVDELNELDKIVGRNGTGSEAGRTLNAQKMGAGEDFSLVRMTLDKEAALGRKLTPQESLSIQKESDRLRSLNAQLVKQVADADARRSAAETAQAVAEMKAATVQIHPKILEAANRIVAKIDARADAARTRIKEKLSRMGTSPDPTLVLDLAEIGTSHLAHGILDAAEWSARMVNELGEKVRPYLDEAYKMAIGLIEKDTVNAPEPVKRAVRKTDLASIKADAADNVKTKLANGEKSKVTWEVQKLAKAFLASGITDREALIDAVHEVLAADMPDWTRRMTMDAISGYGDFRRLSKGALTVQLRGMKGEMQQLAKLEDMAAGKPPLKTGLERRTPTEEERRLIKEVNDAKNRFQVPVDDPSTQLKSALDTLKTTLANRIKDYTDRLARKDYAPRPRREIVLDEKANALKVQAERIKKQWREALLADRLKNRTLWEKVLDWGTKYRRAGVLTSPVVIPKLMSAGVQRLASLPLEEVAGAVARHVPGIRGVAERAPLEGGGLNLRAEMRGYSAAFNQGLKDAWDVMKKGHSDLDVLYGRAGESYTGEYELGSRLLSFPGRLHGMIKAPVKRATFERAVQRYADFYARQGLDPSDAVVKTRIALDAYKAANRSIFLQDNRISSGVTAMLRHWETPAKGETKPSVGGKIAATAGRIALPIMRVPVNIVGETMQYAGGLASGSVRLASALRAGVENLSPEQADLILRDLKKGSVGAAVLALGYFNADAIGGYYQPNKKQKPGDVAYGSIRVYGHDVPSYLLHNPLLETLQIGATVRRVAESKLRKKDTEPQGLAAGVGAAAFGVVEQVPFIREQMEIEKARNPYTRGRFAAEQAKSIAIPAAVQKIAEWTDTAQKRKPRTFGETLKTGIPGLRQQVPEDQKQQTVPVR